MKEARKPRQGTNDYSEAKRRMIFEEYQKQKDSTSKSQFAMSMNIIPNYFFRMRQSAWWKEMEQQKAAGLL